MDADERRKALEDAGRLYDKIGDVAYAKVILVTPVGTICKICKKSLAYND